MYRSGQTPLYRALNLEKHLGIEKIFLKLEGNNPTGHKDDRIAEAMIRFALTKGYERIFVYGSTTFLRSIMYFVEGTDLSVFGVKGNGGVHQKKYPQITWVSFKRNSKDNLIEEIEAYSNENDMFLITEWERNPFVRNLALQKITEECIERVNQPTTIWVQASGGYTLKSTYQELVRNWIKGMIEDIPEICCGISEKELEQHLKQQDFNEHLILTKAKLHAIDEKSVTGAIKLLKKLENITVSTNEAYSLAALISAEDKENGNHIIILNDGKNDITIKEVSKDQKLNKTEVVSLTRGLLEPYHDSVEETLDAVEKAVEKGFIFTAAYGQEIQGVCIVVHMGFEYFIPTYHLAYIGVKKGNKGKGIATELINQAVEKTGGKLSLHVDIPNGKAKKLYERMGFVHMYNRMLYKGQPL